MGCSPLALSALTMSWLPIPPQTLRTLTTAVVLFAGSHAWALDASHEVQVLIQKTKSNLVFVKGGTFKMGDFGPQTTPDKMPYTPGRAFATPLHTVELDSFSMSKYKVTYQDFDVYTDATGKPRIAQAQLDMKYRKVPNVPAGVNWQEAKDYCAWLAQTTGLPFSLPSEAQWEYAARSRGKYVAWGTDNGKWDEGRNVASYEQNKALMPGVLSPAVYPIGKFPPNPLGLYDMAGNGQDWVGDWFAEDYYEHSPRKNPQGPTTGTEKVLRGQEDDYASSVTMYRHKHAPEETPFKSQYTGEVMSERSPRTGFRCVVNSATKVSP
ncbi:formylglycine-generating enzyme family protein [Ralstonia solanacearum]|uniref:formylglycine-generating enzyme family protein n=2 Tax=Ralstonia solanacearum TaxID=305 RepID=UPI002E1ACAC9